MKKYLIAYMNWTTYVTDKQRIGTRYMKCDHLPTETEALDCVDPVRLRIGGPKKMIIAISELGEG